MQHIPIVDQPVLKVDLLSLVWLTPIVLLLFSADSIGSLMKKEHTKTHKTLIVLQRVSDYCAKQQRDIIQTTIINFQQRLVILK
jgi:hypothetical protein